MKIGAVTPGELRAVCEKGLLLVTITIPEMEVNFILFSLLINFVEENVLYFYWTSQHILWPFLLKMIIPQPYTGSVAMVKVLF